MSTLNELITQVKDWLNMPDTSPTSSGTPTNASITRFINAESESIYRDLSGILKRRFASSTTLTYTADAASVSLPAAAQNQSIIMVQTRENTADALRMLDEAVVEEFRNFSDKGTPVRFAVVGTSVMLRPKPTVAQLLTIWYAGANAALAASGDVPSWLNADFHSIIALGAAIRLRRKLGDPVVDLVEQQQGDRLVMERFYTMMVHDNHLHETDSAESYNG